VAGLNILGAKVISRSDHIAIDTFYIVEPGRGVVQSQAAMETFARTVETALIQNNDLYPAIVARPRRSAAAGTRLKNNTLHSSFPPTVEVYHELAMMRTIIDIQTRDQIGLLYRLAKIIFIMASTLLSPGSTPSTASPSTRSILKAPTMKPRRTRARLHALRDALARVIAPAAVEQPAV